MEDMDIEIDIGSDPIQKFLLHKLKEIQLNNNELEQQINRRKELLNNCIEKMTTEQLNQNILEITNIWQKTYNGKCIIGIDITNTGVIGTANNVNTTLQWDSSHSFTYNTNIFCCYKQSQSNKHELPKCLKSMVADMEKINSTTFHPDKNEWIKTNDVAETATIIISFSMPEFTQKRIYNISGILSYEYKTKYSQLNIAPIAISVVDFTNQTHAIKSFEILSGEDQVYLSVLSATEVYAFVVRFNGKQVDLERLFEFDCLLKRIKIISKTKTVFFVDSLSEAIDGSLLVLHRGTADMLYNMAIHSRNNHSCHLFLHYLYEHIPDILILPEKQTHILEEQCNVNSELQTQAVPFGSLQDKLKEFSKAMESQIQLVEKFCDKRLSDIPDHIVRNNETIDLNINICDYQTFRHNLSDLEQQTDVLYNSICKLTGKNKSLLSEENEDGDF